MTPPQVKRVHWPLADPAQATGSETDKLKAFRDVRDERKQRIQNSELLK